MIWNGITTKDKATYLFTWHKVFALFPAKMETGHWVWLEDYECKATGYGFGRPQWYRRYIGSDWSAPHLS